MRGSPATVLSGALTWPNALSLVRIPLAAAFFAVDHAGGRAAIIVAAAASDYADGWLARRLQQGSRAGEMLDPITDKIFLLAAIATYAANGALQVWELGVLVARDVVITIGFIVAIAARWRMPFRARFSGKVVTTLQILAVLALTVVPRIAPAVVLATGAATIWTIVDYARFARRSLRGAATAG